MAMFETSMTALHGWHPGERALQSALGLAEIVRFDYTAVRDHMPNQHRVFHTSNIAFVPISTLDADDRPWVSLLSSKEGTVGFVKSASEVELRIDADVWAGDPILRRGEGNDLLAGLGIEWSSRRRNKFAGRIENLRMGEDGRMIFALKVNQTIGNCPKYISIRTVGPSPTKPELVYDYPTWAPSDQLPDELVRFVQKADTVFIGTSYAAKPNDAELYPSHMGVNHRGGRPGFVRVRNDKRTVVLPDYSGNRLMQSLGNVQATPLAGLTILDFETGDILYLTGKAQNLVGKDAESVMPRSNLITLISITGYTFVRNAMPVRQVSSTPVVPSPYSPPVRYLAEEKPNTALSSDVTLSLSKIQLHSNNLATFHFLPSSPVHVRPGQAAIIDASSFVGQRGYQHMAQRGDESSLNDDGIRTWTVSGRSEQSDALMITMREKPNGFVTSRLFHMVRRMAEIMPGLLDDPSPLGMSLPLVGIDGDFVLPEKGGNLLWFAGGVGITPFLSMLRGIVRGGQGQEWDATLVLAAGRGDVEVFGQLVADALQLPESQTEPRPKLRLRVIVYSRGIRADLQPNFGYLPDGSKVEVALHGRRLAKEDASGLDAVGREVYVCGPLAMEELVVQGVRELGIPSKSIHRENFAY
ncbi:pyridoxamine 5'-phosphate oxidase family protein [Ceratobasidium sp. AG-Ba]|nr:pyridoxamine 5'-phosphate oxidase family protein [Ceratobasidium sp. AG-Ba]QRW10998.1 pyridoxamine 5'-phosphate oxidase family protein [Ceratobasidium sp. AG-Ba]